MCASTGIGASTPAGSPSCNRRLARPVARVHHGDMTISAVMASLPAYVIPGADFPPWAPFVFGAMGLTTLALLIWQAVRYFRDHRD